MKNEESIDTVVWSRLLTLASARERRFLIAASRLVRVATANVHGGPSSMKRGVSSLPLSFIPPQSPLPQSSFDRSRIDERINASVWLERRTRISSPSTCTQNEGGLVSEGPSTFIVKHDSKKLGNASSRPVTGSFLDISIADGSPGRKTSTIQCRLRCDRRENR